MRHLHRLAGTCLLALAFVSMPVRLEAAPAITVTNTNDSGPGSLRQAVADIDPGGTISFAPALVGQTITFSVIIQGRKNVTIAGPGPTLSGGGASNFFYVDPGFTVTISQLAMTHGARVAGGALMNFGTMVLDRVSISNCAATEGGAIYNYGTLTITDSVLANNSATAYGGQGGAIFGGNGSTLTLRNSTISGNTSSFRGGGIVSYGNTLTATNVTIANNSSADGGGVYAILQVALTNVTITGNSANWGGGIETYPDGIVLRNSIVTANTAGPGYEDLHTSLLPGSGNNIVGTDAKLGPLQDNGGSTPTRAPLPGSPAINAGVDPGGITTDQCGRTRIVGTAIDIGAVESDFALAATAGTPQSAGTGMAFAAALQATFTSWSQPVAGVDVTFTAPASGASGAFASAATVATNASGIATAPAFTANAITGSYQVTASVATPGATVTYALTNLYANTAPSFTKGANQSVSEDAGAQTVTTWATAISPGPSGDSGQSVTFQVTGNTNASLFSVSPAVSPAGTLTFTPAAHAYGTSTIAIALHDNGGTANGGADTSPTQSFTITVTPVADTPTATAAHTVWNTLSTEQVVIQRNAVDGAEITHFKITAVDGATLFLADGTTPVAEGSFIAASASGVANLRFMPPHNTVGTGHVTVRASTSASDAGLGGSPVTADLVTSHLAPRSYTLAEGATSDFFDLDVTIANPNDVDAPVDVLFIDANANSASLTFTLPANRSRTISVKDEVPSMAHAEVSTHVISNDGLPLAVERSIFWDATYYGGHTGSAVDNQFPSATWYFGEGFQSAGAFDTFILLANIRNTPATVTLTFLRQGTTPVSATRTVGPASRMTFWAAELAELDGQSFSTIVTSSQPIVAERAMYFGTPTFNGGHESAGVPAASTSWFHAEGRTGPLFDTYILIGNPGQAPAHVTARFLRANDTPITETRTVPAQGRETIYVDGIAGLPDTDVSTEITSDVPVISERSMYWPGEYAQWYEAHNSFGVTSTGLAWALAEGRFGFAQQFETYILVANPTNTATRIRTTFLRQGTKAPVVSEQVVAANARQNVDMGPLLAAPDFDPAGERFGALVESLDNVGIVVERALYFSTNNVFWNGGTNATAVRIR